jgi:hypothetical protein
MKVKTVFSKSFASYGTVLDGYDVSDLVKALEQNTPCPKDATVYQPSEKTLEALPLMQQLTNNAYGGMNIQIGYCNGFNTKLNCLEYHRGSELNIPATDIILLLAKKVMLKTICLTQKKLKPFLFQQERLFKFTKRLCTMLPVVHLKEQKQMKVSV